MKCSTTYSSFTKISISLLFLVSFSFVHAQTTTIFHEDFEGDWTTNWHADAGTWEVGIPTSGPDSAFNSNNCAATVLNGNYAEPVASRLIRHTSFVVPSASENPRLRFWYWFSFSSVSDWGEVQIKTTNGVWQSISNKINYMGGDTWSYGSIDLSVYSDSTIQVAFYFHSINDGSSIPDVSSGWYIDDVSLITGSYVLNSPEDFESGFDDWSADEGSWEVGIPTIGPDNAYRGQNCAGTNLDGNYQESSESRLVSPPFMVPSTSENPRLRFWHWFSFSSVSDWGEVQIKTTNGEWQSISNKINYMGGDAWSYGSIDLSVYSDSMVQVAFYFHSINDGSSIPDVSSGWYIDDVSLVTGPYILKSPEDFESGFDDWSADEGSWEVGIPTIGPDNAHGGQNCAGTNLDGNYQESSESRLISPPFIVPSTSENPRLRFWHWFSFSSVSDWGEVQIKTTNGEWQSISNKINYMGGDAWSYGSIDLSVYSDSTVQVAFYFHSINDGSSIPDVSSGWYVDDVSLITGPYVLNSPEDFESGFDDWSADEGSWEVGIPTIGPDNAHGGQNCAGTNLDGNYQESSESRLVSPPFIVPSTSKNPAIQFWHWFSFSSVSDWGEVQISTDGVTWETISSHFSNTSSGAWTPFYAPLSSYSDSMVQIAFYFHSINDGSSIPDVSSGWYIDDIEIEGLPTGIHATLNSDLDEYLIQNYPNPFNSFTTIPYNLNSPSQIELSVYNILGTKIQTLYKGWQAAGEHQVKWDAKNRVGDKVSSGIYFYELRLNNDFTDRKKMLRLH